ncbi:hypothetical protein GGI07_003817 [Coemansia sp. Benny D115]|nr:hypothetical protein GGI07_003817 [Coemansia sp. Benny D115]
MAASASAAAAAAAASATAQTTRRTIRAVMLDLSGTLHIDDTLTPNAIDALSKLRRSGISLRFVTNSTKTSDQKLHQKLLRLGFNLDSTEIFSSLGAAKRLVQQRNDRPLLLLEPAALEQFTDIPQHAPYTSVVVGLAPSVLDYKHMNQAFEALLNGAHLIAMHRAKYYAVEKDRLAMGPGGFVAALEYAADKKAELVGKPNRAFYELALRDMQMENEPQRVAMIGDDVLADLGGGAEELGLVRLLVRTGKYRANDESKATVPLDGVFDCFADAVDYIVALNT